MGDTVWDRHPRFIKLPTLAKCRQGKMNVHCRHACIINVQQEKHSTPLYRKDITQVLHRRNLLRIIEFIQISANGRFCSIKYSTKQIMETFCTEGLTLSGNIKNYFKPDFKPISRRTFTFIFFLNVPLETLGKKHG